MKNKLPYLKLAVLFLNYFFVNAAMSAGGAGAEGSQNGSAAASGGYGIGTLVPLNFLTESAETLDPGGFVVYVDIYATRFHETKDTYTEGPEAFMYYGLVDNVTLYAVPRVVYSKLNGLPSEYGIGDTDLGIEYRFINDTKRKLDVSIFPVVTVPTGDFDKGLGNGKVWTALPIWLQKRWNDWTLYTGGGYAINKQHDAKDYPLGGISLQKDFIPQRIALAAEIFSQGAASTTAGSFTILDVSVGYNFTPTLGVALTGGQSIAGARNTIGYLAFYWTGKI